MLDHHDTVRKVFGQLMDVSSVLFLLINLQPKERELLIEGLHKAILKDSESIDLFLKKYNME